MKKSLILINVTPAIASRSNSSTDEINQLNLIEDSTCLRVRYGQQCVSKRPDNSYGALMGKGFGVLDSYRKVKLFGLISISMKFYING